MPGFKKRINQWNEKSAEMTRGKKIAPHYSLSVLIPCINQDLILSTFNLPVFFCHNISPRGDSQQGDNFTREL
jgi:hypothetical protein